MLLTALLAGGLLVLINGPWLRVHQIAWAGERFTGELALQRATSELKGHALLTLNVAALTSKLERLPAVASARVEAVLPGAVRIHIVEKTPVFVWQTPFVRLLGVADGTLIGQVAVDAPLPADLAGLPLVVDERTASRDLIVGDRIDGPTLAAALQLSKVPPAALGSASSHLDLRITDDDGFLLVSNRPAWQADFGFYTTNDAGAAGTLDEQVAAQVAAVRTLFSLQPEKGVRWVDARNPGRVYWRP